MKLASAIQAPVVELSEEEFLRSMNDMLQTELEIQNLEHSIEVYEAIFDCIEKEGGISSSLEVMFGENFTSKDTAPAELRAQYEAALEGFFDKVRELTGSGRDSLLNGQANALVKKLEAAKGNLDKVNYPVTIENGAKVNIINQLSKYIDDFYADAMKVKKATTMELGSLIQSLKSKYEPLGKVFDKKIDGEGDEATFKNNVTCSNAQEFGAEIDRVIAGIKKYPTLVGKFRKVIEMLPAFLKIDSMSNVKHDRKDVKELQTFVALHKRYCFMGVHILVKSFIYRGQKILAKIG